MANPAYVSTECGWKRCNLILILTDPCTDEVAANLRAHKTCARQKASWQLRWWCVGQHLDAQSSKLLIWLGADPTRIGCQISVQGFFAETLKAAHGLSNAQAVRTCLPLLQSLQADAELALPLRSSKRILKQAR